MNMVDRQIKITATTTKARQSVDTSFCFTQTEAMPME